MSELPAVNPSATALERQIYDGFENLNIIDIPSRTPGYQTDEIFVGFDMENAVCRLSAAYDLLPGQQLYLVVFRSQRKPGLSEDDIELLTQADHAAHQEAHGRRDENGKRALLHYYKGLPDPAGYCVSWCVWTDEAIAKLAVGKHPKEGNPEGMAHFEAMKLAYQTYQRFGLQTYRLKLTEDGLESICTRDSWTPQLAESGFETQLETPEDSGRRGDIRLQRAIGAVGI